MRGNGKKRYLSIIAALWGICLAAGVFAGNEVNAAAGPGGSVFINSENFPDDYFREVVAEHFDGDKNGLLDANEIRNAKELSFANCMQFEPEERSGRQIPVLKRAVGDFTGIEYLTELRVLDYGGEGGAGEATLWKNPKKIKLAKSLDLTKNKKLERLCISTKTEMKAIDVRGLQNLNTISLLGVMQKLEKIRLKENIRLKYVNVCKANYIDHLDFSESPELTQLQVISGGLTTIRLSACKKLKNLTLNCPQLRKLNLKANKKIRWLDLSRCGLKTLNLKGQSKLEYVNVNNNKLRSISFSKKVKLDTLYCSNNPLKKIVLYKKVRDKELGRNTKIVYRH